MNKAILLAGVLSLSSFAQVLVTPKLEVDKTPYATVYDNLCVMPLIELHKTEGFVDNEHARKVLRPTAKMTLERLRQEMKDVNESGFEVHELEQILKNIAMDDAKSADTSWRDTEKGGAIQIPISIIVEDEGDSAPVMLKRGLNVRFSEKGDVYPLGFIFKINVETAQIEVESQEPSYTTRIKFKDFMNSRLENAQYAPAKIYNNDDDVVEATDYEVEKLLLEQSYGSVSSAGVEGCIALKTLMVREQNSLKQKEVIGLDSIEGASSIK